RRMRRFGDPESFLSLLGSARNYAPTLGARSNFIVGFPGETETEFQILCDFITEARLDAVGVFGYSDEDGTEAEGFDDKLPDEVIAERVAHLTDLAEELTTQRAAERVGESVLVLVESVENEDGEVVIEGRAACQGPEVDGATYLVGDGLDSIAVGDFVEATVVGTEGVDLLAELGIR
ncbi:MAG TPA: 30S ribosomal protein S12 methylthiotransferase RimO, partial [Marmoricola sp.]|nr:30S ribosomal protein S12 methylthiotransferase RimO [Marmoricola sp.]